MPCAWRRTEAGDTIRGGHRVKRFGRFDVAAVVAGVVLLVLADASTARADITSGLIGWWALDGRLGTRVRDDSGLGNDGILYGTTFEDATTTGVVRAGIVFDGVSDHVGVTSAAGGSSNAVTLAVWCKRLSDSSGYTISIGGTAGALYVKPDGGGLRLQLSTSGGTRSADAPFPLNEWIHLVATFAKGDYLKVYTNGVLAGQSAEQYDETMNTWTSFGLCTPYSGRYLHAAMDEARAYNRALSAADVAELYASRESPPPVPYDIETGLIGWWKFDEADGTTLTDDSGFGNHGTLINMTADASSTTNAIFGRALEFDGVNQYVDVNPFSGFNSNAVTIAVWARKLADPGGWTQLFGRGGAHGALYVNDSAGVSFQLQLVSEGIKQAGGLTLGTEWMHVAGTFSKGDWIHLYVNGVRMHSSPAAYDDWIQQWTRLWFARYANAPTGYMNVILDEARIYDRALSSDDIEALYFYAPPPPRGTLIRIK